MPTKGVAISQIILLVLGIIVLAVVAFLLYSNFSSTTGQVDFQKCRAAATNACTACSIATGSTLDCKASVYLRTPSDIACAGRGLIGGATATEVKNAAGAVTSYSNPEGVISCSEFIGGGGTAVSGGGECKNLPVTGTDPVTGKESKTCTTGALNGAGTCCV